MKKNKKKSKKKVKNKNNTNNSINRFISIVGIILVLIAFIAFILKTSDNHILKSEYKVNEVGYLDKIEVTLKNITYIHSDTGIEISFDITNKTDNTITIVPDTHFKFYDINHVQIPNKYTSNKSIVKKNETITYRLQYDVTEKEIYEIYFYSGVVENNIKFSFKSSDIQAELIPEGNQNKKTDILES